MKLASFLSLVLITGFLFVAINKLHPVGAPLGNPDVLKDRSSAATDIINVNTMDDYYLRNSQTETGSNNVVSSIVFDYRGFDTLGEATVLFLVVTSISMLLSLLYKREDVDDYEFRKPNEFPGDVSRIISYGSYLLYPLIITFGVYLVIHGHLSPGGGFQGGAVMASGTALLLVSALITRHVHRTRRIFSFFESLGLTIFISMGFAGIGTTFLYNFLANGSLTLFGRAIPFGPNPGFLNSGGVLPVLSFAIGVEVFFGLSIILVTLFHVARHRKDME
ncbi:MAG TPA: MnhB domain-containing protein [Spirochaetota bacterium]|nr:MnhB domain-containing protein [Spirochaetota bacterium]